MRSAAAIPRSEEPVEKYGAAKKSPDEAMRKSRQRDQVASRLSDTWGRHSRLSKAPPRPIANPQSKGVPALWAAP